MTDETALRTGHGTANGRRRGRLLVGGALGAALLVGGALSMASGWLTDQTGNDPNAGRSWSRLAHDESIFGEAGKATLVGVAAGGPGFVAVGYGGSFGTDQAHAAVWTSPDGTNWSRVPHQEEVFGGPGDQAMTAIAAGKSGLVAVGVSSTDEGEVPAVWTSPDGTAWARVPLDDALFGEPSDDQALTSVAAFGDGFVAVGFKAITGAGGYGLLWTSPDGRTWSPVAHDEAMRIDQFMLSVAAGESGLVAVGAANDDRESVAAAWTSPDGKTWSRVPHDEAMFGGEREWNSVAAGGPGFVAVGLDARSREGIGAGGVEVTYTSEFAAVWTSPDGKVWSRAPHDEAVFGDSGLTMTSVVAGGPGLVAVGYEQDEEERFRAAVWTSPDGIVWSRVPHDEAVFGGPREHAMSSVAAGGSGLVAVGNGDTVEGNAAVWISK